MHKPISRNTWYSLFSEADRYPHYRVNGVPYFSKFDAMCAARETYDIRFRCYDLYLGRVDFSKEPEIGYQELCKQRAIQLREKYRYIRMWYSGGVDSHTALMSFYRAGVSPDEICFMSNKSWDSNEMGANFEFEMLSIPMQTELRRLFPAAKQRVITFHYDFWKTLDTTNFHDVLYKACLTYPLGRDIPTAFEIDPMLWEEVNKGNMCELTGEPKPYIFLKDGEWWTSISDFQLMNMLCVPNLEMFHLAPDATDIYVKQCHMVKRGHEYLMEGKDESYSLELDTDLYLKNRLLERKNEFDLSGVNSIDTQMIKYRDSRGDRISVIVNAKLMEKQSHTKKLFSAYERIFNWDMAEHFGSFMRDNDSRFRDTVAYRSSAWSLDRKKAMPIEQIWPKGYGAYE